MKPSLSKRLILLTVILMDILAGMEFDLFVPSFPELQRHFSLTPFWVEALLSANFIGFCLSLLFVGALADHYGRRPIILLGLMIFIIGSIFCLWGPHYEIVLVGRFLQGVGIAAPAILSFLIISDSYPLKQQQSLLAILNGVMNTAVGIAPVMGSYITLYFHWQGNFMALLLLGMITLLMVALFIPSYTQSISRIRAGDRAASPMSIVDYVTEGESRRSTHPKLERRRVYKLPAQKEALSIRGYIPIFRSRSLMLLTVHFICNFLPYWIFVGMSPLLYMEDLGVSLSHFGFYQGSMALVFALGSFLFGFIASRYDQKNMLRVSAYIFIAGFISIAMVTFLDSPNPLFITLAFLPFIIGQIIPSNILFPIYLNLMPHAKGRLTAISQGGRLMFSALCLQIAGHFYEGSFRNIGLIICTFILMTVITLFIVVRDRAIMESSHNQ